MATAKLVSGRTEMGDDQREIRRQTKRPGIVDHRSSSSSIITLARTDYSIIVVLWNILKKHQIEQRDRESFIVVFVLAQNERNVKSIPGNARTTHAALTLISIAGTRPDKWGLLNRVIDLSDLRRQQLIRKWQTNERNMLTCRVRLRHCIRRKDY